MMDGRPDQDALEMLAIKPPTTAFQVKDKMMDGDGCDVFNTIHLVKL